VDRQLFDANSDPTYHFDAGSDLDPDPTMLENLKPFPYFYPRPVYIVFVFSASLLTTILIQKEIFWKSMLSLFLAYMVLVRLRILQNYADPWFFALARSTPKFLLASKREMLTELEMNFSQAPLFFLRKQIYKLACMFAGHV
jgi:hypothetical protein